MQQLTIAIAGNPNSGKTTIFNSLTGSHQHVGNYPGVTVEKKEGSLLYKDVHMVIIDLPGTYSMTSYSPEEIVARQELLDDKIDVVINVVDATNAERSLNLTAQLKELGLPMVVAFNMTDDATKQGISFDYSLLSTLLEAKVLPVIGIKKEGLNSLLDAVLSISKDETEYKRLIRYDPHVEEQISLIQESIPENILKNTSRKDILRRWYAVKLLEKDHEILKSISIYPQYPLITEQIEKSRETLEKIYKLDPEMIMVEGRYAFVRGAIREAQKSIRVDRRSFTDSIDRVLLNRLLGLPIFLGIMWLLFQLTFKLGVLPMTGLDLLFNTISGFVDFLLPDGLLKSFLIDGIIGGIGGVLIFLPNILLLFLGIGLLEGTGYMARAAFVTDKFMHKVGLHGKSFIPMVLGFGCTIPAVMATRTLENSRDRLVTILIVPLMSCGARLPVYTLLISAFFDISIAGNILFSIYLIGILLAIIMAKLLRTFILPGESEPFVMELPVYRLPTLNSILIQLWIRTKLYLRKAGTLILVASVIMWSLFTFPLAPALESGQFSSGSQLENSYAGRIGHVIEPVLQPLGLEWKSGIALISGLVAKEMVVSTLSSLYSIEDNTTSSQNDEDPLDSFAERARARSGLTPLTAYVLMLFILIYIPCLAAVIVIKRETNSIRWPLFTVGYTLSLAWIVCFIVYRGGLLLGFSG